MRIFLSCASKEFGSYRRMLTDYLRARRAPGDHSGVNRGIEVQIQEHFQQGGYVLLDRLADYIRECDWVIHLVGEISGVHPSPDHVRATYAHLSQRTPMPLPGLSYTQWEYELAHLLKTPVLCYIAQPKTPRDGNPDEMQGQEEAAQQRAYVANLKGSGKDRRTFGDHGDLLKQVLHDLGFEDHRKINNLPYTSIGTLFKGREKFLQTLRQMLGELVHCGFQKVNAVYANALTVVVYGLGGVGKTRAAIEYAHRYAENYTSLLFVEANSQGGLKENLANLASADVLNLPERIAEKTEDKVNAVRLWLKMHPGWLLILNNVDSPDAARAVDGFLGDMGGNGQTVITSVLSDWSAGMKSVELRLLEVRDASDFLLARTDGRRNAESDDADQARSLAVKLGQLPLVLEQAVALIRKRGYSFADYEAQWQENNLEMLDWFDERVMQYPRSFATTWLTSFLQLSDPAKNLLRLLSWLAPDPIPISLLEAESLPSIGSNSHVANPREAFGDLAGISLATWQDDKRAFTVHRLVQDITRANIPEQYRQTYLQGSLEWMNGVFVGKPQDVRSWPVLDPVAPHAATVAWFSDESGIAKPTGVLFDQLGILQLSKGQYAEAEPLIHRGVEIAVGSDGPESQNAVTALNNLAFLFSETNRFGEAESLLRFALATAEKKDSAENRSVAGFANNLGELLRKTKRLGESESLLRRALAINEKNHGLEHPQVAAVLNNLGLLLNDANCMDGAEPMLRRALEIDENSLGFEDRHVGIVLNSLGLVLQKTRRFAEAEPLMRRALKIDEKIYGPEHPSIGLRLHNLAKLLQDTNRPTEAEPLLRRSLAICEKSYKPGDRRLAVVLTNLARLLLETCRPDEAVTLMQRALETAEKSNSPSPSDIEVILVTLLEALAAANRLADTEPIVMRLLALAETSGRPDHPNVSKFLKMLAGVLQNTHRPSEAEPLMRRALAIDEKTNGLDHTDSLMGLYNLASLLADSNRHTEAEPFMRRVLGILEKNPDLEHPIVEKVINYLSVSLLATNQFEESELLMRRGLDMTEKRNGSTHSDVALILANLAQLLERTARPAEALPLRIRALEIQEKNYGREHPTLATNLYNLALLLQNSDRLYEAEALLRRLLKIDETSKGPEDFDLAQDLRMLAMLLQNTGRYAEAEPLMRRGLAINERMKGPEHPLIVEDLHNLAQLLQLTNRLEEAEPLLRRSLEIVKKTYGAEHTSVTEELNNLAILLEATGCFDEAESLFRCALKIMEANFGPDHLYVVMCLANLAQFLCKTENLDEAEVLIRRGLEIHFTVARAHGHFHPTLPGSVSNYAFLLRQKGCDDRQIQARLLEMAPDFNFSPQSGARSCSVPDLG